jgi:hypothetical protein
MTTTDIRTDPAMMRSMAKRPAYRPHGTDEIHVTCFDHRTTPETGQRRARHPCLHSSVQTRPRGSPPDWPCWSSHLRTRAFSKSWPVRQA